jgi:Tfp pilus assembly protein PilO
MKSILSLLSIVGAIALFFMYTKPTYDGLQKTRETIVQYDLALSKAAELQSLKQALLSRYNAFNPSHIERLSKLLPDHVDNVRLLLDLDTLASQHGLALQNVVISGGSSAEKTQEQEVIGPDTTTYDSLTFRFATTGGYEQFVTFMNDLEKSLRIVDVEKLSINSSADSTTQYKFDITLRTYWLK